MDMFFQELARPVDSKSREVEGGQFAVGFHTDDMITLNITSRHSCFDGCQLFNAISLARNATR